MKLILTVATVCALFSGEQISEVALNEDRVTDVQVVSIEGKWYVALLTEPIFTLSERSELCDRVKSNINKRFGVKASVLIDAGLFFDIKYLKTLSSGQEKSVIEQRIKNTFLRRANEYQGNNQSQKKRTSIIC